MNKKRNCGVLLFISVLCHSLLVLFPLSEKSRPLVQPLPPANPISVVDAGQLPELPAPEPQSSPVASLSPPVAPANVSPPIDLPPEPPPVPLPDLPSHQSDAEAGDRTISDPEFQTTFSPTITPTPSATPSPTPSVTPGVSPVDEAKIAAEWENLVGYVQRQSDGLKKSNLLQILNLFGEPEQIEQFFDESSQPKIEVLALHNFIGQTPEQVFQTVRSELTNNTGFDLQHQENFTAGLAYQVLQGDMLRYLIIVELNADSGSILILSDSLPEL